MSNQINILDKQHLKELLLQLQPDTTALWGKMTPQQMVEHLVEEVKYTNGKKKATSTLPPGEAEADKKAKLQPNFEMPRNVNLGPLPEYYRFPTLETAINELMQELEDFDKYYNQPAVTAVHFAFGPMNRDEWLTWHTKHFTHHFRQFGLLP